MAESNQAGQIHVLWWLQGILAVRPTLISAAMADLLGAGQKFDEINVPIHQSLTTHLDYAKKMDIRQGSQKLGAMCADAQSEQVITMPFLKEKLKDFGSGEFEVSGICNPWHLFDPSLLASPTVTIRREAIEEIKTTFLQKKPHGIPQEFRILCSWDGRQKLTVRPSIGPENMYFVNLFEMMSGMFFESDFLFVSHFAGFIWISSMLLDMCVFEWFLES